MLPAMDWRIKAVWQIVPVRGTTAVNEALAGAESMYQVEIARDREST
jgi:hypothetical protein